MLYRNLGDGTFVDVAGVAGVAHRGQSLSAAWGDFDADADADLYVCNFTEPNVLYRNEGDGSFADITNVSGTAADHIDGFITFVLDYDNDGQLDIFVGNWSSFDRVLADRAEGRSTSARTGLRSTEIAVTAHLKMWLKKRASRSRRDDERRG